MNGLQLLESPQSIERNNGSPLCAADGSALPVVYSSATEEWATPQDFYDRLHKKYAFTLDVCATPENAKCARYYTKEQDGLRQPWSPERCWMNPPYGRDMAQWVKKAWLESQKGALVVCLVPARTDVRWWHDYAMKAEVHFVKGRLKFRTIEDEILRRETASVKQGRHSPTAHAPFASAVLVYTQNDKLTDAAVSDAGKHK